MNLAKELDQFYTNPIIANRFVEKIKSFYPLDDFDNVIEPSAGTGNIFSLLPEHNRIGLDLDPKFEGIEKCDFFDYKFPKGKTIVIGNPPFGRKCSLAVDFLNKSLQNSDAVAFIIPRGFMRSITQKGVDPDAGLYWSCVLPDYSFIYNDQPYNVRCCAQLWAKTPPQFGSGGFESWDENVNISQLKDLDEYYNKTNCYEKPQTLFGHTV